jgi:hypothetical protein
MNENFLGSWNSDERTTQDFDQMVIEGSKLPPLLHLWGKYILLSGLLTALNLI